MVVSSRGRLVLRPAAPPQQLSLTLAHAHTHTHTRMHTPDRSAHADAHSDAAGTIILLAFPEFLELVGLLSFVVAWSHGWKPVEGGSVLGKVKALVLETAALGAPWARLAQGHRLMAAVQEEAPPLSPSSHY